MEFESQFPYEIEFVRKRSSSAVFRDGKIFLRISGLLSTTERKKHIEELLLKLNKKLAKTPVQEQLLNSFFDLGNVTFFDEEKFSFYLTKGSKVKIDILTNNKVVISGRKWPIEMISLHDAISNNLITKKDALHLFTEFCELYYLEKVAKIVHEWQAYIMTKKQLKEVKFSTMNTRWGTCSSRGVITIAIKTLLLPEALFESVCVHEVAHLDQMNHGKNFWKQVLSVLPNYRELKAELKKYH